MRQIVKEILGIFKLTECEFSNWREILRIFNCVTVIKSKHGCDVPSNINL